MHISDIVSILYPDADRLTDIVIQDDGDGLYIAHWNEDLYGPQPTEQDLLDQAPSVQLQHTQRLIEIELRILIESKPSEKGYDSVTTLASYTASGNAQWKAEADAFIAWRDSVFAYVYQVLADVQAELIPLPTVEDFMSGVPTLTWPQ